MQAPWCYVSPDCLGGELGSFGRRHAECPLLGVQKYPDNSGGGSDNASASAPYPVGDDGMRWVAPPNCPCSGVRSKLGYGAFCRAWELESQTPWCYTFDNCSLASANGRTGSFGHRYVDCVLEGGSDPHMPGRRLQRTQYDGTQQGHGVTRRQGPPHRRRLREAAARTDPDEDALLERVEHLRQPHVALVSLATEGFVSVELPPHRLALKAHARTDALSLKGVLSFLPSGAIMSLSTNALLSICEETVFGEAAGGSTTMEACTSFRDARVRHPKLLRSEKDAHGMAKFKVEFIEQQGLPKPGASPVIKGGRGGRSRVRASPSGRPAGAAATWSRAHP